MWIGMWRKIPCCKYINQIEKKKLKVSKISDVYEKTNTSRGSGK